MIDTTGNVDRKLPFGQYQYVDVRFGPANMDTTIKYELKRINPERYGEVRWLDVTPQILPRQSVEPIAVGVATDPLPGGEGGGVTYTVETSEMTLYEPAIVYRPAVNATPFGPGYVVLRCTVANYATRLLLFTERNEASSV